MTVTGRAESLKLHPPTVVRTVESRDNDSVDADRGAKASENGSVTPEFFGLIDRWGVRTRAGFVEQPPRFLAVTQQ